MKNTRKDVSKNERAMAKLLIEAQRTKEILSANQEAYPTIEGLYEDVDFRYHVTRQKFEELCSDLLERVVKPIETLLTNTGFKNVFNFFLF